MYDVIVVGAGPAGSAASKRCAEHGLKTLLIEKRGLPRDKVCSGMVMGPLAHKLIKEEFGDVPGAVLAQPPHLSGYRFHVPGIGSEKLENYTLLTWRRDLDYWMSQKAQASGVEIWDGARVVGVSQQQEGFSLAVEKDKDWRELETRFVVGADGATSVIRRLLFSGIKMRYGQVYQEHYRGEVDLEKDYFHWFYPIQISPSSFTVHVKDGLIVVDVGARLGQTGQVLAWAKEFLAQNYKLAVSKEPVWRGACLQPAMYRELTSYSFKPGKGNALLVGDAAGLIMPVSGEGIGVGIKSALLAASSIVEAVESDKPSDGIYLPALSGIISVFGEMYPWFRRVIDEAGTGGHSLPQILRDAYRRTLSMV